MQVGVNTTGLKERAQGLRSFERLLMGELNAADNRARRMIMKEMQNVMESGGWAPNADAYRRWKISHGYDGRPLLRMHLLKDSVTHERVAFSPSLIHARVGWPRGAHYPGRLTGAERKRQRSGGGTSAPSLAQVAKWLEGGSRGPARPFVAKTRQDVRPLVVQQFHQALARAITGIGGAR